MTLPLFIAVMACAPFPAAFAADKEATVQMRTRALYLQLIHQVRADGRPRAAIAYLDDFDRQYPNDLDARLLRVNSLLDLGQVDQAETVLGTLARSPASAGLSAARGHVWAARGEWAKAVPFYSEAAAANPTEPMLKNALGYALLRIRNIGGAIEQLRAAADIAPGDEVIRNNLVLALILAGSKAQADQMLAAVGDRQTQVRLRRQIADEASRIGPAASVKKGS
jgi:Flp pilus assembly protein TadD